MTVCTNADASTSIALTLDRDKGQRMACKEMHQPLLLLSVHTQTADTETAGRWSDSHGLLMLLKGAMLALKVPTYRLQLGVANACEDTRYQTSAVVETLRPQPMYMNTHETAVEFFSSIECESECQQP